MISISYMEYGYLRDKVISQLPYPHPYHYVISIPYGGNILSSDIAQHLEVPLVYYNDKTYSWSHQPPQGKALLVDEIIDSGVTIATINVLLNSYNFDILCLYTKKPHLCKFWAKQIPFDHPWIKFPWEF